MKRLLIGILVALFFAPAVAAAQTPVDEYGEESLDPAVIEQIAPLPAPARKPAGRQAIEEKNVGSDGAKRVAAPAGPRPAPASPKGPAKAQLPASSARPASTFGPSAAGREKRVRVGFIAPGIGVFSQGYGAAMVTGLEGEYFFFERLSAGMRFEVATKFEQPTWISIVPRARYIFDFDRHPRFAAYVQAGVGAAISAGNETLAAADIAIPGGGFWWQWTERFSVGADTNLHILARSQVAVGWTLTPTIHYIF